MDSTDNIETSAKSNHPSSRNAHTEMEAKNEISIGSLRSFRMNKQNDDIQISSMKLGKESIVMRNDIERKEKTLEEIMFPNFDEEESANFDISSHEGTQVHQEMVKKVAKGGLISEGDFVLVPLPTKGAKSLP